MVGTGQLAAEERGRRTRSHRNAVEKRRHQEVLPLKCCRKSVVFWQRCFFTLLHFSSCLSSSQAPRCPGGCLGTRGHHVGEPWVTRFILGLLLIQGTLQPLGLKTGENPGPAEVNGEILSSLKSTGNSH